MSTRHDGTDPAGASGRQVDGRRTATPAVRGSRGTSADIRELKDNLSRYIRRVEAGERIAITARGRAGAELVQPDARAKGAPGRFDELIASGVIRPPLEAGDPTGGWPDIRLAARTAAALIDADRGEAWVSAEEERYLGDLAERMGLPAETVTAIFTWVGEDRAPRRAGRLARSHEHRKSGRIGGR